MKEFRVITYDYDHELCTNMYIDCEDFDTKEEALRYAKTIEHTISSRTVITGDYGYKIIARCSRRVKL